MNIKRLSLLKISNVSYTINNDEKDIELTDRYLAEVYEGFEDYIEGLKTLFRSNWKMIDVVEEDIDVDNWDSIIEEFLEHEWVLFIMSSNSGIYEE